MANLKQLCICIPLMLVEVVRFAGQPITEVIINFSEIGE